MTLKIGLLTVKLRLYTPTSLKEKRSLIKGLIAHLRRDFNVSVAELDHLDQRRAATLGIATLTNDGRQTDRILARLIRRLQRDPRFTVEEVHTERL